MATLGLCLALVAGCGDDDSDSETSDTTGSSDTTGPGVTVPTGTEGTPVDVELGESSEDEQYMEVTPDTVAAGYVTFRVSNAGTEEHELLVLQTDVPFDELEETDDERVDESSAVGGELELEPGESGELTVELEAGNYVLVCNKQGHYAEGMAAPFVVT